MNGSFATHFNRVRLLFWDSALTHMSPKESTHKPLQPNQLCSDLQSLETGVQTSGKSQLSERGSVIHHTSVINSSMPSSNKPSPAFLYSQASQLTSCHPEIKQETLTEEDLLQNTSTCNSATLFWDGRGSTQWRTAGREWSVHMAMLTAPTPPATLGAPKASYPQLT